MAERTPKPHPRVFLRVELGPAAALGPGKADLLEGIAETGSIAGAARRLGMSYTRGWRLVETLNAMFASPLVEASRGASGGARLTQSGTVVLQTYRAMQVEVEAVVAARLGALPPRPANRGQPTGAG